VPRIPYSLSETTLGMRHAMSSQPYGIKVPMFNGIFGIVTSVCVVCLR
jgi:hypothetical protein